MNMKRRSTVALGILIAGSLPACAKPLDATAPKHCASDLFQTFNLTGAGSSGLAKAFQLDPITSSGNLNLSPVALNLDDFAASVTLQHLGGRGILEGTYVDIRNGLDCQEGFGAFQKNNEFSYVHADGRFQEAMAYYYGDLYRASLDVSGSLLPTKPVKIVAHCMLDDNAFFVRATDRSGQLIEKVCLGDSAATPGASYGDDAMVTIHELQHATTADTYSATRDLNRFFYDEAGALNEAVSDYMALANFEPIIPNTLDSRDFSRWALGAFIPNHRGIRGAHKCTKYDASLPNGLSYTGCDHFSAANNTITYTYPDGLGWPYANNFDAPGYLKSAFINFRSQEEIHNADIIIVGALFDVYEALKTNHGGNAVQANQLTTQLLVNSLAHLPKPTLDSLSPVSFTGFATGLVTAATTLNLSTQDQTAVTAAVTARGLYGFTPVSGWATPDPGAPAPGMKIEDNPVVLKGWLNRLGSDSTVVTQTVSTGAANGKFDPGDAAVIWFDLPNYAQQTIAGLQVTASSDHPELISFMDDNYNVGAISTSKAQIQYGKVNGKAIVAMLQDTSNDTFKVPTGNSYFLTNPFYNVNWKTGMWVKVNSAAAHGASLTLRVDVVPSNGDPATLNFPVTIN